MGVGGLQRLDNLLTQKEVATPAERARWAKDASQTFGLKPAESALLDHLAFIAGRRGKSWGRSQEVLALELGKSKRTIERAAASLTKHGLIQVYRQGQTPSEYFPVFEMKTPRVDISVAENADNVDSDTPRLTVDIPVAESGQPESTFCRPRVDILATTKTP